MKEENAENDTKGKEEFVLFLCFHYPLTTQPRQNQFFSAAYCLWGLLKTINVFYVIIKYRYIMCTIVWLNTPLEGRLIFFGSILFFVECSYSDVLVIFHPLQI